MDSPAHKTRTPLFPPPLFCLKRRLCCAEGLAFIQYVERELQHFSLPLDRTDWRAIKRKPGFSFALQRGLGGKQGRAQLFPTEKSPGVCATPLSFQLLYGRK